jgi:hypothetical protein
MNGSLIPQSLTAFVITIPKTYSFVSAVDRGHVNFETLEKLFKQLRRRNKAIEVFFAYEWRS